MMFRSPKVQVLLLDLYFAVNVLLPAVTVTR